MKTIETDPRLPAWINVVLNSWPFCLDADRINTFAFSIGPWGIEKEGNQSQLYNGAFFLRLNWPLGIAILVRWVSDKTTNIMFGWKLNGRFTLTLRIQQTDVAAAAGILGPNLGQATGWNRGPH